MQRFFVAADAVTDGIICLTGDNANHISFSLRMKRGDKISVCTPDSCVYGCTITDFQNGLVIAHIDDVSACDTEPPYRVHLYQALPKGDKFDTIIQKAVECGVYSVTPFESSRCIAKVGDSAEKKLARWNRIASEAAKQCGRGIIPQVLPVMTYSDMLKKASDVSLPIFCYEERGCNKLGNVLLRGGDTISVVVGAEGGFSEEEAQMAKSHGMILTGLGNRILRCETASSFVLACISMVRELS